MRVGRKLVESLRNPTLISNNLAETTFAIRPRSVRDAIARALVNEDREFAATRWSDAYSSAGNAWRSGRWCALVHASSIHEPSRLLPLPNKRLRRFAGLVERPAGTLRIGRGRCAGFLDLLVGGVGVRRGRRDAGILAQVMRWTFGAYELANHRNDF